MYVLYCMFKNGLCACKIYILIEFGLLLRGKRL